jgi:hypothetical protein
MTVVPIGVRIEVSGPIGEIGGGGRYTVGPTGVESTVVRPPTTEESEGMTDVPIGVFVVGKTEGTGQNEWLSV